MSFRIAGFIAASFIPFRPAVYRQIREDGRASRDDGRQRIFLSCISALILAIGVSIHAAEDQESLRLAIIVSRHGVRSPVQTEAQLESYTHQSWPAWSVAPGILTEHGRRLMLLMGKYYGERFRAAGLLPTDGPVRPDEMYACSDDMQRTIASAQALADGIAARTGTPVEVTTGDYSPLHGPHRTGRVRPDPALAAAAVGARAGGDLRSLVRAYRSQFDDLDRILGGDPAWSEAPMVLHSGGEQGPLIKWTGPISVASNLVENFILEYAEGQPSVGWGRITRENLADCYLLKALHFDLTQRTLYIAQAQGSNLATRILRTIDQSISGHRAPGALGLPGVRVAIVGTHDGNVINLAGLLGVTWTVDGLPLSPPLPGGALLLELWQHASDQSFHVRGYYVAQTLDQMRNATPLNLATPPAVAELLLPGGTAGPGNEAPVPQFEAAMAKVIDARYVDY